MFDKSLVKKHLTAVNTKDQCWYFFGFEIIGHLHRQMFTLCEMFMKINDFAGSEMVFNRYHLTFDVVDKIKHISVNI